MLTSTSGLYPVTPAQMASLSAELVALGDSLEAKDSPSWMGHFLAKADRLISLSMEEFHRA
ncbi:MAG: hypothetical protein KGZ68_12705 [Dechloromonas sp.]|nr:hypothetical protein [Dechloromonas sp.]